MPCQDSPESGDRPNSRCAGGADTTFRAIEPTMPTERTCGILGGLEPEQAAALIVAAADVILAVDAGGIIRDAALRSDDLSGEFGSRWLGQPWVDTVTPESRPNVEDLLRDAVTSEASQGRQVNHPSTHGADVPVMYSAVRVGGKDTTIAVGRDMRAVDSWRSRVLDVPKSVERLGALVGRVPLRDIVRDVTDVIERRCIEAALDLTRDNRALAAELLGLSRQSLYVKLRRFGLGDLGGKSGE